MEFCLLILVLLSLTSTEREKLKLSSKIEASIVNGIESLNRPFFVRVFKSRHRLHTEVCGGSIVGENWVLTAAHCLQEFTASQVFIELADFTQTKFMSGNEPIFLVEKIFTQSAYLATSEEPPYNDVALIKTKEAFPQGMAIELCEQPAPPNTLLGHCGMGSVSRFEPNQWPKTLREAYFYEVAFECRHDLVCAKGFNHLTAISIEDTGGPLYEVHCGSRVPKCLYGVANSASDKFPDLNRNSYFAKVTIHLRWIKQITEIH